MYIYICSTEPKDMAFAYVHKYEIYNVAHEIY